jgi:hypothetical protein
MAAEMRELTVVRPPRSERPVHRKARGADVDRGRARCAGEEAARSCAFDGHFVVGVQESASIERQAPAPDARPQVVADPLEILDLLAEHVEPARGDPRPVVLLRGATQWKLVECLPDVGERNAGSLRCPDEREAAQYVARVPALVPGGSHADDQPLPFVEVQRRHGDAAAGGDLADGELVGGLQAG